MPLTPAPAADTLRVPASAVQQRLWLAAAGDPTGVAYNLTFAARLQGDLDVSALRRALDYLARRHEALRTSFEQHQGTLLQVVSMVPPPLPLEIEAQLAGGQDALTRLLRDESSARLDLAVAPLARARLVRLAADDHVLCLTLHHLICDGWSLEILARELGVAYGMHASHVEPDWPAPPLQYADVSEWQRQHGTEAALAAVEYWTRELEGAPAVLPLPYDFERPAAPTGRGHRVATTLAPGVTMAVKAFARQHQTTPAATWLALYALFLHRWAGVEDIPIGTPALGRELPDVDGVVGAFVNTIVPRFRFATSPTLVDAVGAAHRLMLDGLTHQHVPLDQVLQRLAPLRVPGVPPLFQVMFAWQPAAGLSMPGLVCTRLPVPRETSKVELTLFVVEEPDRTSLTFEFSEDLFHPATMAAGLAAFDRLAVAALAQPRTPASRLPWLSDETKNAMVAKSAGAARPYPRDVDLATLFRQQCDRCSTRPALDDGNATVSYAELSRRASAVAADLIAAGVRPGDRVALLATPGASLVVGVLGVVMAGGVYVPIDPADPIARIRALLEDSGAVAVVADDRTRAEGLGRPVVDPASRSHRVVPDVVVARSADDPVALMYTSGSTGSPKAVVVPHRAVARLVINQDYLQIDPRDRIALASNPAFDASTFELWGVLLNGATAVPVDTETLTTPRLLRDAIRERQLTVLFVTTAVFNLTAATLPAAFAPLRALLFGGERSNAAAVARVLEASGAVRLLHMYGPTECTTFSTWHLVTDVPAGASTIPIGRPIANTSAAVLDEQMEPVPQGVAGELYLGGDGLALGYHGVAAATDGPFVHHPRWRQRLYRTGDRCRLTPEGNLQFIERLDRQVKLRGFRIELEEIERTLVKCPPVTAAAVDVIGEADDGRLVAGVVAAQTTDTELHEWMAATLPAFMRPSAIVFLDYLPMTARGKIDRRALRSLFADKLPSRTAYRTPRDPLEAELVSIWEEQLGTSPIGIDDDFFALGGHSLLAAQIMEQIDRRLGRRVPLDRLFHHPTVAQLAALLWEDGSHQPVVALREAGARPPLFFAHGDINGGGLYCRRLADALEPNQPFYVLGGAADSGSAGTSIEQIAATYRRRIEELHPDGPLAFAGYCHGALVAYELARQFQASRDVTNLVLVHPSPVEPRLRPLAVAVRLVGRLRGAGTQWQIDTMVRLVLGLQFAVRASTSERLAWIRQKLARGARRDPGDAGLPAAPRSPMRHDPIAWERIMKSVIAYVPPWYDGRVTIVTGDGRMQAMSGWRRAVPQATFRVTAGTHETCVTSELASLAVVINSELQSP